MGLFGESRKEREEREERSLAAILRSFETLSPEKTTDLKKSLGNAAQESHSAPTTTKQQALDVHAAAAVVRKVTVEDLVIFLAKKGVITLSEWEKYKAECNYSGG